MEYKWARRVNKGEPYYECSSKGDKRFSPLYAKIGNVTIEELYQLDIKGYRNKVKHWKEAKGLPPLNKTYEQAYKEYKALWRLYLTLHLDLLQEIAEKAKGKTITDMFATSDINQAHAICDILNEIIEREIK